MAEFVHHVPEKAALEAFLSRENHKRLAGEEEGTRSEVEESGLKSTTVGTRARASSQRRRRLLELPKKQPSANIRLMRSLFPLADQKQGAADRLSAPKYPLHCSDRVSIPTN